MRITAKERSRRLDAIEFERTENLSMVARAIKMTPAEQNQAGIDGTVPDLLNPAFILSQTHMALLVAIADGRIDIKAAALRELKNRGLDSQARYVGHGR